MVGCLSKHFQLATADFGCGLVNDKIQLVVAIHTQRDMKLRSGVNLHLEMAFVTMIEQMQMCSALTIYDVGS